MFFQFIKNRLQVRSASVLFWITMLITGLSILIVLFVSSVYSEEDPVVKLSNGKVIGFKSSLFTRPLYTYLGIPYALPADQFRFQPSQLDNRAWSENQIAKNYGPGCPQPEEYIKFQNYAQTGYIKYSEDCLNLNIWTPIYFNRSNPLDDKQLKPVIVFIHGGALLFNSASEEKYFDGTILASLGDVVVVTLNYRLGILGFLYDGNEIKGNLGLLDQRLALEWIHKNIKSFGGDPNKITLSGESAGSWSVGIHLLLEKQENERRLFHNAIMMSGAPLKPVLEEPEEVALKKFEIVSKKLKCTDIKCLQTAPLKELMDLHFDQEIINLNKNIYRLAFQPVYGPVNGFLSKSTYDQLLDKDYLVKNTSLLIGNLVNEGQDSWTLWRQSFKDPQMKEPKKSKEEFTEALEMFLNTTVDLNKEDLNSLIGNLDKFYFNQEVLDKLKEDQEMSDSYQFSLQGSFYELLSDIAFVCPSKFFAEKYFDKIQKEIVFEYEITYESMSQGTKQFAPWCEESKYGPCHMLDLQYIFGRPFKFISKYSNNDRALSYDLIRLFSQFSRTGKVNWKSYFKMNIKRTYEMTIPTEFELNPQTGNEELIGMHYLSCVMLNRYFYNQNDKN